MWGTYRPYYEKEIVSMGISSWQWLRYRINVKKVWSSVEKCVKNRQTNWNPGLIEGKGEVPEEKNRVPDPERMEKGWHNAGRKEQSGSEKRKSANQTRIEAKIGSKSRKVSLRPAGREKVFLLSPWPRDSINASTVYSPPHPDFHHNTFVIIP